VDPRRRPAPSTRARPGADSSRPAFRPTRAGAAEGVPQGARGGGRFSVTRGDAGMVIATGEIDMGTCRILDEALEAAGRQGHEAVVLDLLDVQYLHSRAVAVLFDHATRGHLRLRVQAGSALASVVRICGLPHVAEVNFVPAD
jgi:anti-anti-sigma factor